MSVNRLNVRYVVNASGRMSSLGVSTLSDDVINAMKAGGQHYYVMEELHDEVGKIVARTFSTEAAFITNSASAAIALSVAGCVAKDDEYVRREIHNHTLEVAREVVVMKGHNVNYGAPVEKMIQLGGGVVREAGFANGCSRLDLEAAITDETIAFLYVQSHHCVQKNMPTLREVSDLCSERGIPLIVDAAAEEEITAFVPLANIVILSGSKAIEGPTSGILVGTSEYIRYAFSHNNGMGRAMKIGKEAMFGLLQALQDYGKYQLSKQEQIKRLSELKQLESLPGVKVTIEQDEAGRDIFRGRITIDEKLAHMSASELVDQLQEGDVAIFTRDYNANIGYIEIDPRPLLPDDMDRIVGKTTDVLGGDK